MIPDVIHIDGSLPSAGVITRAIETSTVDSAEPEAELSRLHRVFYPVYRVSYCYDESSLLPWQNGTNRGVILLDGLWSDNHAALQPYRSASESLETVSLDPYDFGRAQSKGRRSILLDFQVPTERAQQLLPDRIEDVAESAAFDDPNQITTSFMEGLQSTFDLPDAVDPTTFQGIEDVTRLYLPFWIFEVYRPDSADWIGAARTVQEIEQDGERPHRWLSSFLQEDRSRLARFAHEPAKPTNSPTDPEKVAEEANNRAPTRRTEEQDNQRKHESKTHDADATSDEPETSITAEPVQPEGVDLEAKNLVEQSPDRCFADVGGMERLKQTIRRTVLEPVERPESFRSYGLDPVSGVLFHGPPGCGKTYVSGAIAGELDYALLEVTPADLSSKYMGKPAENVSDVFTIAKANSPCVCLLDEIDAIASDRADRSNSSERAMVNQLLTELEDCPEDVLVLATTNLLEDVDDAILRTGRFDERIEVPPPDGPARRAILEIHLEGRPVDGNLELGSVVERTAGYASSDLAYVVTSAARRALREGERIGIDHLLAAVSATDSSVPDWGGSAIGDGKTIVQPEGVELNARSLVSTGVELDFTNVGGMSELKGRLRETVIDPIDHTDRYEEYGLGVTSGILLYGPPGCGKTYVTQALAGELDTAFLDVTPADLTSKWMGKPARNVADLFEIARQNAPCLLFIDEIDAIASARGRGSSQSQRQMVNQLLTELETLAELEREVVVVAATNLLEDVDDAILRSGRFDERIECHRQMPRHDTRSSRSTLPIDPS